MKCPECECPMENIGGIFVCPECESLNKTLDDSEWHQGESDETDS